MRFIGIIIAIALAITVGIAVLKFTGGSKETATVATSQGEVPPAAPGAPADNAGGVVANPQAPVTEVPTVNILVASKDIPVGTVIEDSSYFDQQPWPKHLVLNQFITADQAPNVIKMVARAPFLAREPLILSKLANPNDPSFLAAMLPEGMRVVTIATDAPASIAGFAFPGDRVDVLYTHEVEKPKPQAQPNADGSTPTYTAPEKQRVTEILVSNVKVLAVDQRSTSAAADKLVVPTTVSIEVAAADAQKIRLGEREGSLALALRSLKDEKKVDSYTPTLPSDITAVKFEQDQQAADVGKLQRPIIVVRGVQVEVLRNTGQPRPPAPAANDNPATAAPTAKEGKK